MTFAHDTAIQCVDDGRFTAHLHDRWSSLVGIHGGFSAAIVARAIAATVDDADRPLRTIAVQFASSPRPGPAEVEVMVERAGRSMTTTSARLLQAGKVRLVAHAVSSPAWPGLAYDDSDHPRPGGPGAAPIFEPPGRIAHFQNAEVRLDPDVVPFGGGERAWVAAWLRPLGDESIDATWLVAMCDMLPPAVFSRTTGPVKAATIEYVVHLATAKPELPRGEHAYISCHSPLAAEGFAVELWRRLGPGDRVLVLQRSGRGVRAGGHV